MRLLYACVLALFLVCGCNSRIPEPIDYHYSQQQKMQATAHWEVLAADLADRINERLVVSDNTHQAVFVKETCGDEASPCKPGETSSFNEAFHDLLITRLYGYGIETRSKPAEDAIEISYKVQLVHYNADRVRSLQPGLLTGLSAAIMVLRDAPSALLFLAGGATADVANTSMVASSNYEVIVTTSMVNRGRYLFRSSDIYYINAKDFLHYQDNMPKTTTIKVSKKTGDMPSCKTEIKTESMTTPPGSNTTTNSLVQTDRQRIFM